MAATCAGQIRAGASLTGSTTTGTLGAVNDVVNVGTAPIDITSGSGTNQGTKMASGTLTLVASTPQTLDLAALVSGSGTHTLTGWKYMYFYNPGTTLSKYVTVEPGDTNPATIPTLLCYGSSPQQISCLLTTGVAVDGTHKTIKIDPGANDQTLYYVIMGI